jgi:hypothetical protein
LFSLPTCVSKERLTFANSRSTLGFLVITKLQPFVHLLISAATIAGFFPHCLRGKDNRFDLS